MGLGNLMAWISTKISLLTELSDGARRRSELTNGQDSSKPCDMNLHRVWLLLIAFSLSAVLNIHAGHPEPVHRQTQGRRDANMALLQFQNALAADRWDDALFLCSADVQNQAK